MKYPYYGISGTGNIVNFESRGSGITVFSNIYGIDHYSKEWHMSNFTPLTNEQIKEHNLPNLNINIKKGKEKMTTEYKTIKEITGKEIILNDACENEAKKFIEHFGVRRVIKWTKENEDYIVSQNSWIGWLLDKGFIEANKIEYDKKKLYFHKYSGDVYKLDNRGDNYFWFKFDTNVDDISYWNANNGNGYDSIEEAIKYAERPSDKIKSFDTFEEAIKFYFPNMNKSEELTDDMSKLKKMKEWMDEFDFSVDCDDFDGCNASVDCDYCPFQTK